MTAEGFDETLYVPKKPEFELYLDKQDNQTVGAKLVAAYGDDKYNVLQKIEPGEVQAEQEKNVTATQKKVDELNAQQAEAQNVVNSLDSQLQAELAAEAEANAALQAGINASTAEKATVNTETAGTTENTNNGGGTSNNGSNTPAPTPTPAPAPTPQPSTPAPAPTPSAPSQSVDGGTVVSRAYSTGASAEYRFACLIFTLTAPLYIWSIL